MRKLTIEEVTKFASRSNVRKIAVENFLSSMHTTGGSPCEDAARNLDLDAGLYHWNKETYQAIRDGIRLACSGEEMSKENTRRFGL